MNQTLRTYRHQHLYFILVLLAAPFAAISLDICMPSLPYIEKAFHTSQQYAQYTVFTFSLGFALSQIPVGLWSDQLGRKPLILSGSLINITSLFIIIKSQSISVFLSARFVEGLATAFIVVPSRAILMDIFEGAQLKKSISILFIFWTLSAILSPYLGGYLQYYGNWTTCFQCLLLYNLLLLFYALFFLKETLSNEKKRKKESVHLQLSFFLTDRLFWFLAFTAGIGSSYLILFHTTGTFIIQNTLHFNAKEYGYMTLLIGTAALSSNIFNYCIHSIHQRITLYWLGALFTTSFFMLIQASLTEIHIMYFLASSFMIILTSSFIFARTTASILQRMTHSYATGSALFWTTIWGFHSAVIAISSFLPNTSFSVASTYFTLSILLFLVFYSTLKRQFHGKPTSSR